MGNKILPKFNNATYANVSATTKPNRKTPTSVRLEVTVNDKALRNTGHDFNGLEQAFALVPTRNKKNQIEWKRVEIPFAHRSSDRGGNMYDIHSVSIKGTGIRTEDLKNLGVAYGLKTNTGEVWLQYADDNYKLPGGR